MKNPDSSKHFANNGKAIASLIVGILSIINITQGFRGIALGIIGLILGIVGLKEIARFPQEGRKMAIAGIVCSSLGILIPLLLFIVVLIFISLL